MDPCIAYRTEVYGKTISSGITRLDPEKRKNQSLVFPVKVENEVLKEEIKKHQGDSTEVKMYITQFVNLPFFKTKSVEVVKVVHMRISIIPEVRIKDVEVLDVGLDDMRMLITLSIYNPNNMDFTIKHMKSYVQVKDYATSYSESDKTFHIKR
jgi:LEA14-like dessication related protein